MQSPRPRGLFANGDLFGEYDEAPSIFCEATPAPTSMSIFLEPVVNPGIGFVDITSAHAQEEIVLYDVSSAAEFVGFWRGVLKKQDETPNGGSSSALLCIPRHLIVKDQEARPWNRNTVIGLLDITSRLSRLSRLHLSNVDIPFVKFFEVLPSLSNLEFLQIFDVKVSWSADDVLPPCTLPLFRKEVEVHTYGTYPFLPPACVSVLPVLRIVASQAITKWSLDSSTLLSISYYLDEYSHTSKTCTTFTLTHHGKSSIAPSAREIVIQDPQPDLVLPLSPISVLFKACGESLRSLKVFCPVGQDCTFAQTNRVHLSSAKEFAGPVELLPLLLHPKNGLDHVVTNTPICDHPHLVSLLEGCPFGGNRLRTLHIGVKNASLDLLIHISNVFSHLESLVVLFTEAESFKQVCPLQLHALEILQILYCGRAPDYNA
ncbi:hypothetical protein V5O48_007244 [Marasmius crinis-equi]|uniref:FBD domain-containing protein n=1 Tax=Marasmius crinis-equi TaxID=585013 RepID=A0ABR3FH73_9AGAR